jgi:hypothetical protein
MYNGRLFAGLVRKFSAVDDGMGNFLPRDANWLVLARPVAERASLAEDAQAHITHRQAGDYVFLLHGLVPFFLVHGRSGRFRWRCGLRLENIDRAHQTRTLCSHRFAAWTHCPAYFTSV